MTTRTASCSCGKLSITCEGDPVRVSVCHCFACQKRTGSAFGAQARFARDKTKLSGSASTYVRIADSGSPVTFMFCANCGSTVCWILAGAPDVVAVALGAFADLSLPAPTFSVYEDRKHPWVPLLEGPNVEHWS